MNILVLNQLPLDYSPYHEWYESNENKIYLLSSTSAFSNISEGQSEIISKYEDVRFFNDFSTNGMVDSIAIEWGQKYDIDKVVALGEFDLIRAAKIRNYLGLPGQCIESAMAYRDKVSMKEYVSDSDIYVPKFIEVNDSFDLVFAVREIGFPCVLKTRCGGGSIGTEILKGQSELENILKSRFKSQERANYILEEYIEGPMYHIDGVVIDGEIKSIWPSLYVNGCLAYQQGDSVSSYTLEEENPLVDILIESTAKVIASLPSPESFAFHCELFIDNDNRVVFCEIASRVGGGGITESYSGAMNINLERIFAGVQVGINEKSDLGFKKPEGDLFGWTFIPPKSNIIISAPNKCDIDWVDEYRFFGENGGTQSTAVSSASKLAKIVFRGANEQDMIEKTVEISKWFYKNTMWQSQ